MIQKPVVYIDVERMKYKNIGLYTFCNELVSTLKGEFEYKYFGNLPHKESIKPKWFHKIFGVRVNQANLWHATHQDTNYLPMANIPIVLTIHDLNFLYANKSIEKVKKRLKKVQKLVDRSDYIVVISNFVLKDVQKHIDLKGKPIRVIYNGTIISVPSERIEKPLFKKNEYLFTIGTVVPKKNFHVLLNLLVNTSYSLIVAGIQNDKEYLNLILSKAKELKVEHQLELVGAVSETEKDWYYKNCKAFLFPSLSEGFGLPVIEAMRYGKPVFCSNLTSLPEIGGTEAFYFKSFDEKHMQHILEKGLADFEKDLDKSKKIIDWSKQFTWEKTAENYQKVYKSVLDEYSN